MKYRILFFLLLIIIVVFNLEKIKIYYVELFKLNSIFVHYNENGKPEGMLVEYINGKIINKCNYVNGSKEGEILKYDETGQIFIKGFCKNDQLTGKQFGYYKSGKLNYVITYRKGKQYGDAYLYSENGKLKSYNVFGIDGEKFCSFQYDQSGKIKDMNGFVVSQKFYSFDTQTDSLIVLDQESPAYQFKNIKDFYLTVATPPGLTLNVNLTINNKLYKNLKIQDNIIKFPNAFSFKGRYKIFLESHLLDKFNKGVNGINMNYDVVTE